ncbi:MAG TPA: 4Fe-4S dicluster domain-containing protein [Anaeromyxobacter sp.]
MDETRKGTPSSEPPPPAASSPGRRDFLATALGASGGVFALLAGGGALATSAEAGGAKGDDRYDWEAHQWAYLIDTEKCIGCGSCVRACKAENGVPDGYFRTWVERYLVAPDASHVDSPNGGLDGFAPVQTAFEPTKSFFVPKLCNHCKETPCVQVCPVGASYRTKDGVVLVDGKSCIGCGYCVQACPYGSRFLSPETHTAEKCTWCYHRITKGLKPACVEVCPTATRQFGDMKRDDDPVRLAIAHGRVQVLQANLLTEPQAYYLGIDKEVR